MLRLSLGARPRRAVVGSIRPLRALSTLPSNGPTSQSAAHAQAARDPESYWCAMSAQIDWVQPPGQAILDGSRKPFYRWFPDATLNTCFNAVDRHVAAGHGARVAIYYDSPVTQQRKAVTYAELQTHVATVAGMLAAHGVGKGDRVMLYMPMVPEAIYGMLACARLGAVHSVVFGGFASKELAKRIEDSSPKVILTASCGIEGVSKIVPYKPLLDEAIALSPHKPLVSIVLQRPQGLCKLDGASRTLDWEREYARAKEHKCVTVNSTDPLYILYTSGTTGKPKGVVRDNGGHAVAVKRS